MEKVVIELEAKTDKALKGIDNVAKSVEDLNKTVTKGNKDTADGLKGVEKSSNLVGKGIKGIGTALKAAGIGLIIGLLGTLKDLFEQNQKAVDLFNVVFETSANVVGQVVNAFTDIYDALTKSSDQFDALGKVIKGLLTIAITPLKLGFYELKLAMQLLKLGYESMFGDDKSIQEAKKGIEETKTEILNVGKAALNAGKDIATNFVEAVSEVGAAGAIMVEELGKVSVSAALNTAKANVELQKSAELGAARQGLIFEKFDRQAEKLRQIRDDETKSITERKKANDELLVKISKAEKGMLSQAKLQLALANQNLQKDKDNVEFKVAQIEATKELAGIEAQIEGIRSEQKSNALALDKEAIELTNSKIESESNLSTAKKKFAAEQILNEQLRLEKLIEINEAEKIIEEERLQAIVDLANGGTQAKIDAQIALDEFTNTNNEENIALKTELVQKEIDLEAKRVASKHQALNDISSIFGAESAMGKAALIAKQLMAAQELLIDLGAIKSKATKAIVGSQLNAAESGGAVATGFSKTLALGFPAAIPALIGYVASAAGIVSGVMAATKKTKSVASSFGGTGGGGGGSAPSIPAAPSLPPAFNVVGASDTNQLADAIGGQSQEPVKAYVVSGDVTSAQSMDRNIIDGASI